VQAPRSDPAASEVGGVAAGRREPVAVVAPSERARVRVRSTGAGPASRVAVAWVDRAGRVHPLELGADDSAPRPAGSANATFLACAPGFTEAFARTGDVEDDVELVLQPTRVLRGRIVEDGGAPRSPLYLRGSSQAPSPGLPDSGTTRQQLEDLGVRRSMPGVWTEPDGSFSLPEVRPGASGTLFLPTTHRPVVDGVPWSRPLVRFEAQDQDLVITTALLPRVVGRLSWQDDGRPVVGELFITGEDRSAYVRTDERGAFSIGLAVEDWALLEPPETRSSALRFDSIRIRCHEVDGVVAEFEHEVELSGQSFPLDLGVLRVPRAVSVAALVLDPAGRPIEGARVASSVGRAWSAADGRVELPTRAGDELRVLAPGHAYAVFPLPQTRDGEAPVELQLEPGHTLVIEAASGDAGTSDPGIPIQLAWDESPFEEAYIEVGPAAATGTGGTHEGLYGEGLVLGDGWPGRKVTASPGSTTFQWPGTDDLVLPGLRAGSTFSVRTLDRVGQPLSERAVTMPMLPGVHRVDLSRGSTRPCRLRLRLVDGQGDTILADGRVFVEAQGEHLVTWLDLEAGLMDQGPLRAGVYSLEIREVEGYLPRVVEGYELGPDAPVLELEFGPGWRERRVEVALRGTSGAPISADRLELRSEDGWSHSARNTLTGWAVFRAPIRPLQLTAQVGTRTYSQDVGAQQAQVTVTIPDQGRLEVHLPRRPVLVGDGGSVRVRARESGSERSVELEEWCSAGAEGAIDLHTSLLPGDYDLEVDLLEWPAQAREGDEPFVRSLLRETVSIDVEAATRVEVQD